MRISPGKVVQIEYTLTGPDGEIIDSSRDTAPLAYLQGAGNIIPGLERALEGKSAGDEIDVVIAPQDGYGDVNEALIQEVPRTQFPGVKDIAVGGQFQAQTAQGPRVVTVINVTDDTVTVDANHPLAGVTLRFAVRIVTVRTPTPEELNV